MPEIYQPPKLSTIREIYESNPERRASRLLFAMHKLDWKRVEAIRWAVKHGRISEPKRGT